MIGLVLLGEGIGGWIIAGVDAEAIGDMGGVLANVPGKGAVGKRVSGAGEALAIGAAAPRQADNPTNRMNRRQ